MNASLSLTLVSCGVLGFRHGFDYDHIAAITDIASVQKRPSEGMLLGLCYALGHVGTIALLGGAVLLFQRSLPHALDAWAERAVGATLIVLALYVAGSLVRGGPQAAPPSRAALLLRGYRALRRALGGGRQGSPAGAGADIDYTGPIAFCVGVVHGLGAETPSQLALFLLAANLGGTARGIAGMGMFLAGLLAMNTLMSATACGLFRGVAVHPRAMRMVAGVTAAYSFTVGCCFLLGLAGRLPALA
jgi:high-affinity nickel-transport protein